MKIIDLFSGIGGFSLGFQRAGYHFTEHYFSEIDKHAIANYKYNFPHAINLGDITTIRPTDLSQSQAPISTTLKANGRMSTDDTYIIPKEASTLTGGGHSGGLHSDMTVIQINPSTESNGRQPYQQNRVFDENGISPSLTRHNSNYAINRMRRLTEIECERLQGFPDNWTQYGDYNATIKPIARTQRYKLIGNAVTVDIVELIAKRLKFIENEKSTCNRIRRA